MKRRRILLTSILVVSIASAGIAKQPEVFFRKIALLGSDQRIEGRYAVEDSATRNANVYRFSYDSSGRVVKVEYLKNGQPYTDPIFGVDIIAISYSTTLEKRDFEDASRALTQNTMKFCSQVFKLDSAKRVSSILNFDKTGNVCDDEYGVAEYRVANGEGSDSSFVKLFGKNGDRIREEIARFDSSGNMIEIELRDPELNKKDDVPAMICYGYDGLGNLTRREFYTTGGQLKKMALDVWKYDKNTSMHVQFSAGELRDAVTKWEYDQHGNVTAENDYGADERLTGKALYAYDASDNLSKFAYFEPNGNMTKAVGDWGQRSEVPPPDFFPVDNEPQVTSGPVPVYPELAQRAGIEGRVLIKIWVGEDGKPRKAVILRSDNEILNQPSIDAAMSTRFTPAIMDNEPVQVWVVVPYTFKLR